MFVKCHTFSIQIAFFHLKSPFCGEATRKIQNGGTWSKLNLCHFLQDVMIHYSSQHIKQR